MSFWLVGAAWAADWWVNEPAELGALRTALPILWPEEASTVTLGAPPEGRAGYAWDGAALISLADGRRQGCADAAQAVLIARSWSKVVSEPGGSWIPAPPPAPASVVAPPAARRLAPPSFDLGVGLRLIESEPGPVDGETVEIGLGWPGLRASVSAYLALAPPGTPLRSAVSLREDHTCDPCGSPSGSYSLQAVERLGVSAVLDSGPVLRLPRGLKVSPRAALGLWSAETEAWYFGSLEVPGEIGVLEGGVRGGLQYGGALDVGRGRFALRASCMARTLYYSWAGREGDLRAAPWVGVSGRVRL